RLHLVEMFERRCDSQFVGADVGEVDYYVDRDCGLSCVVEGEMFDVEEMSVMVGCVEVVIVSGFYGKLVECEVSEVVVLRFY
ncbi:hypothetical protein, partial [Staphylococcus pettenkoferi]|uniref:hypothetical protein n=1 Tax=Staphylococcus pettenkoferi TaxID=170573 RepID=UPI001C93074C